MSGPRIAIVLKGYPRLSETFIAQEILALEKQGLALDIWSLRKPTDRFRHPMHAAIRAPVAYLPEYLRDDPARVLRGLLWGCRQRAFPALVRTFCAICGGTPPPRGCGGSGRRWCSPARPGRRWRISMSTSCTRPAASPATPPC